MELKGWKEKREGRRCRGGTFLSPRLPLSPVSHLRRCGTGINGIQEHGEMAAGTMCASYMGAAGESQSIVPRESQSVKIHMQTLRSDGQ